LLGQIKLQLAEKFSGELLLNKMRLTCKEYDFIIDGEGNKIHLKITAKEIIK